MWTTTTREIPMSEAEYLVELGKYIKELEIEILLLKRRVEEKDEFQE